MGFLPAQTRKLKIKVPSRSVRQRDVNGQAFSYVEGWFVISEANRIFGFDGWDRETLETKCLWAKQIGDRFSVAYLTKVKVSIHTGERRVVREGTGFGEAGFPTAAQSHEFAVKASETDATKRALVTFGSAFGLALYAPPACSSRSGKDVKVSSPAAPQYEIGRSSDALDRSISVAPSLVPSEQQPS